MKNIHQTETAIDSLRLAKEEGLIKTFQDMIVDYMKLIEIPQTRRQIYERLRLKHQSCTGSVNTLMGKKKKIMTVTGRKVVCKYDLAEGIDRLVEEVALVSELYPWVDTKTTGDPELDDVLEKYSKLQLAKMHLSGKTRELFPL